MKKSLCMVIVLMMGILVGCAEDKEILRGTSRGNDVRNVEAARIISEMDNVNSAAVMRERGVVVAGIKLNDKSAGQETCDSVLGILKNQFPEGEYYIVGADEEWAEDVIELCIYTDEGMDKEVLEKRFDFLVSEKMEKPRN